MCGESFLSFVNYISMKQQFSLRMSQYFQDNFVQWTILSSLFLNVMIWGMLLYFIRPSDIPILLRYNVYLGFDLNSLVSWYYAFYIPLAGSILFLINGMVSFLFFRRGDFFASYIILFGGVFIQISAMISAIAIILVNE